MQSTEVNVKNYSNHLRIYIHQIHAYSLELFTFVVVKWSNTELDMMV